MTNSGEVSSAEGSQPKRCDTNNNSGNKEKIKRAVVDSKPNDSYGDEWHLLEVDDDNTITVYNNNNSNHSNLNTNQRRNGTTITNTETISEIKKKKKKYIEINTLSSQEDKALSPTLIYICTAIYSLLPVASTLATFTLIGLIFTRFYLLTVIYFAYVILDRNTCNTGGRRVDWVYRSKFWTYLAAYFPIRLRYSTDFKLNSNENYILNYAPHGIAAFGSVTVFGTNGLKFKQLFPGITTRFLVHETSHLIPVMKETFALRGDCSVNSKSIDYLLNSSRGNLLTIVVGGLAEADLSDMEKLKIVVANRKGFVKKALIHGANIIPCIAFGENSVFNKVNLKESSLMHTLESKWYKIFKFKHPIYYGRSIISETMTGLMPYKRPITVVMGDPIHVGKIENPTQEQIDKLHAHYLDELRTIYKANQDLSDKYDKQLELV